MLHYTFKLIYRNLLRFKSTFFINLIGLSSGLACALFIYLWIIDELGIDKFHQHEARLFQVMEKQTTGAGINIQEATPIGMAHVMAETMPEVEYAATVTPMAWFPKFIIEHNGIRIKNEGKFVGKDFFQIFSFDLLYGNQEKLFKEIDDIVISEPLAIKLFGSIDNAAGKSISWGLGEIKKESIVSGVFKTIPSNSSEQFDLLLNIELLGQIMGFAKGDLSGPGPSTFLTLKDGTNIADFNNKVTRFMSERTDKKASAYFVTKFSDKYLYGKFENGIQTAGRMVYVKLFGAIGLIILLIACINFMNLSTAKASRRIKEVGIKKAMGAWRKTLVAEYLAESFFLSVVALLMALLAVLILLPYFNDITGKQLALDFSFRTIMALAAITFLTGVIAGSYPAFYLSGFKPALVLKGKLKTSSGEVWARKGLVVFQFAISVIFIVSVMVIYKQMSFIRNKNLGYDKDNVLYLELEGKVSEDHRAFLDAVRMVPGVKNASAMVGMVGAFGNPINVTVAERTVGFHRVAGDYGMIETLGIRMKAGRSFSSAFNDTGRIILNSMAVDKLGIADPVGTFIDFTGRRFEIIGVTENFHYTSLHEEIAPLAIVLETEQLWNVLIKLERGREEEALNNLKKLYKEFNPGFAFDFNFLDNAYQAQYASEERVASLSLWFAILAIVISCLGLFGLAAFTAERRVKEMAVRKVLGATTTSLVYLLSVDFIKLVIISILIALPVSFYVANEWLERFAYTIDMEIWFFAGAGAIAILISVLTVGSQAIQASLTNPATSLKDV